MDYTLNDDMTGTELMYSVGEIVQIIPELTSGVNKLGSDDESEKEVINDNVTSDDDDSDVHDDNIHDNNDLDDDNDNDDNNYEDSDDELVMNYDVPFGEFVDKVSKLQEAISKFKPSMPKALKNLLHLLIVAEEKRICNGGQTLAASNRVLLTEELRHQLEHDGFAIIHNVLSKKEVRLLKQIVKLVHQLEGMNTQTIQKLLCKYKSNQPSLLAATGWSKFNYFGFVQQYLSTHPVLWRLFVELYNNTRLTFNFYETKVCFPPRKQSQRHHDLKMGQLEFFHLDTNPVLVDKLREETGVSLENYMYQSIIALTPMHPNEATVYFAKGYHKKMESIYRNSSSWSNHSWKSVSLKTNLDEMTRNQMLKEMVPVIAPAGSVIVFNTLLPHAPNKHNGTNTRISAYVYMAPVLPNNTSYLPNSIDETRETIQQGKCPIQAAHPYSKYTLSKCARHFVPSLKYVELPRTKLGDCEIGVSKWEAYEHSRDFAALTSANEQQFRSCCSTMQAPVLEFLTRYLAEWEPKVKYHLTHLTHSQLDCATCTICKYLQSLPLASWWHTIHAVRHRDPDEGCKVQCSNCQQAQSKGWIGFEQGECNCDRCSNKQL